MQRVAFAPLGVPASSGFAVMRVPIMNSDLPVSPRPHAALGPSKVLDLVSSHCAIYAAFFRYSLMREMSFKVNFLLWLLVEFLWFGLQLGFNSVLYLHTDSIGTWTKWEVVMLIGTSHFIQQLFQAFFLVNCSQLSNLVQTGTLDFLLLLPKNTRFLVSFRYVDMGGFISAASGLGVVFYAARQLHLTPSCSQIFAYTVLCLVGVAIHYSLMFLMATVSFWTIRAHGLVMAYYNLFSVARLPDVVLKKSYHTIFVLAIPMLLVSNVPVKVLAAKLASPFELCLLGILGCGCFLISQLVWRAGLRTYKSASS
jgi:ABC-2 type transport system permease protein